ncbi:hypothetical protein [Methylobacterium sp. A54F]
MSLSYQIATLAVVLVAGGLAALKLASLAHDRRFPPDNARQSRD